MSFHSRPITNIFIFLIAFFLAQLITNSFNFMGREGCIGLYCLVMVPVHFIVLISIMSFIFFLFWNIMNHIIKEDDSEEDNNIVNHRYKENPYTQIRKLEKTKVLSKNKEIKIPLKKKSFSYTNQTSSTPIKTKSTITDIAKNTLTYTANTIFGVLFIFSSIIFLFFYSLESSASKKYEKTFHEHHQTNDYNDSRIIFYNNELEKYTYSFMQATTKYDIFKSYSEREMALQCITILLKEHRENNISKLAEKFKLSARNESKSNNKLIIELLKMKNLSQNILLIRQPILYIQYEIF